MTTATPRRARRRPVLAMVAVAVGLAVIGGTAGAALGAVGAASSSAPGELHHRDDGPGPGRGR